MQRQIAVAELVPSADERALRIRQYEDFFNVSGMGTPDDLEDFRACQVGYSGADDLWNDLSRGAPMWIDGPDDNARAQGFRVSSSTNAEPLPYTAPPWAGPPGGPRSGNDRLKSG